jgi:hypothetical protein
MRVYPGAESFGDPRSVGRSDDLGATIFFQLVSALYLRRFDQATTILDRLLHHSTTINIRGESCRLKDGRVSSWRVERQRRSVRETRKVKASTRLLRRRNLKREDCENTAISS